ncbi:MAG TPA: hypothetical protein VGG42_15325 [Acidobacteriaceae bacterium]|jgi:hypothetical protein
MSSDEKKRRRERFLLDRFLEKQGMKPKSIDQLEPPSPDFLIDLDGRLVGIEITEIFIRPDNSIKYPRAAEEPLLQEIESITDHIVSQAREIYFQANNALVLSTIVFAQITRDKQDGRRVAELIADKVEDMVARNPSEVVDWKPVMGDHEAHLLSKTVAFIHVRRVPEKRFARWTVARAGAVATLTPKHLQDRITTKARKLKNYGNNKNIEEIWLLMIADRGRPSQMLRRGPDFSSKSLSSPFAKTFYYCYGAEEPTGAL